MREKIIQQGAEAVLIRKGSLLLKKRVRKGYRIKELDEKIRKRRTRREGKLLVKAGQVISVPRVVNVSEREKEIEMEFISGKKLSESLDSMKNWKKVCSEIGKNIAKLHDADIIHGDLTTSNMIFVGGKLDSASLIVNAHSVRTVSKKPGFGNDEVGKEGEVGLRDNVKGAGKGGEVYFIDFGLGFANGKIEDKAVDLYLIKEALEAKHFKFFEKFWKEILKGYKVSKNYGKTMERLKKVEKRGRYKAQF